LAIAIISGMQLQEETCRNWL